MNRRDRNILTTALRSGEYKQCTGKLHDGVNFCCLGVAEDVLRDNWWYADSANRWHISADSADDDYDWLREKIGGGLGRTAQDNISLLIDMNDSQAKSFPEIADWIEANL